MKTLLINMLKREDKNSFESMERSMDNIIITVRMKTKISKGNFAAIIEDRGERTIKILDVRETTGNRIIIKGLAELLKSIEDNSTVRTYIQTNIGFAMLRKMIDGSLSEEYKWCNSDVAKELVEIVLNKNIKISFSQYKYNEDVEVLKELEDLSKKPINKYIPSITVSAVDNKSSSNSENNIYNTNILATTNIEIIVRGYSNYAAENRPGMYMSILKYGNKEKMLARKLEGLTVNQCIITGLIESIKLLKKPCNIKFYTHTYVGLAKYNKCEKSANSELLKELFNLLYTYNHSLEENVGEYRQQELIKKIRAEIK